MKKWIFIFLAFAVVGIVFYKWFFNQPCVPPDKPSTVPASAIWSGGCDGGEWIDLVSVTDKKYRFRIYRDWNGDLMMDADFKFDGKAFDLNERNWTDKVCCYTQSLESEVLLKVVSDNQDTKTHYQLKSVYPAYGGDDWEVIKEKYNLE